MSALGRGRVKAAAGVWSGSETRCFSGRDRGDQRLDTDDVHDPCQIVGQDRKRAISAAALGSVSVRKCVAPIEP
jgi:hypothetical protein